MISDNISVKDFPKIECPFKRKMAGDRYVITPEIDENYKWVFEDEGMRATDKINGTSALSN